MGGAPPLPHDFAPEGAKNRKKLCDFGPWRQGAARGPKSGGPGSGRIEGPGLGPAGAPAEAREDPRTPVLRGAAGEKRDQSVADSSPCGESWHTIEDGKEG